MIASLSAVLLPLTPSPFPEYTGDTDLVTPGVLGFVAIAAVAIATVLLILDMTRRIRRVRYRSEVREKIAAERVDAAEQTDAADPDGSAGGRPGGRATGPADPSPR